MAKSRTNKDREAKVAEYKQKVKKQNKLKSMEAPKFRPFRQVPHWEPDAKIEISGDQFSLLQNFFNVFAEPINVMQDIFSKNLNSGTITVKYVDNEGKEVSKEEVQAYMEEVTKYLKAQAQETSEDAVVVENPTTEDNLDIIPQPRVVEEATEVLTQEPIAADTTRRKLKVVTD